MKLKSLLAAVLLTLGLAVGAVIPAQASLNKGPIVQSPAEGGTWEYGFWNVYARSYYTTDTCHGSTVVVDGSTVRSIDTAANARSIAEKFALNQPFAKDSYYYRVC